MTYARAGMLMAAIVALPLVVLACDSRADPPESQPLSPAPPVEPHPFSRKAEGFVHVSPAACLDIRIEYRGTGPGRGFVVVENQCGVDVAILTQPVEIRVGEGSPAIFPEEISADAAYAIFFLSSGESRVFRGSGWKSVFSPPRFTTVASGDTEMIRILNDDTVLSSLPTGEYKVALVTPVAPAGSFSDKVPFDFSASVERYNADAEHRSDRFLLNEPLDRTFATGTVAIE